MKEVKNKGGRPTKKDDDTIKKLEDIFKIDGTAGEACSYAGISEVTYYDWFKNDKEFSKKMKAAQDYPFILARKTLMKGMKDGDQRSAIEYLKRRDKRYKDKQELGGENGAPLLEKLEVVITNKIGEE